MRWLGYAGLLLALLIAVVAVIGVMLPEKHVVTRHAFFRQSPEAVFALITGPQNWRPDVARWEEIPNPGGPRRWREYSMHGNSVTFEETASDPPRKYQAVITDKNLPFSGTWTWEITPANDGCDVRITENGEIHNPIFRFAGRFVMGYSKTMTDYLKALGKKFGEPVSIHK